MPTIPVSTGPASPVYVINGTNGSDYADPLLVTVTNPSASSTATTVSAKGWNTVTVSGQISVNNVSTQLLGPNLARIYAYIANNTLTQAYLQFGSAAQVGKGIRLNAGGVLTLSGFETYLGAINAISTSGTIMLDVLEGEL